MNKAVLTLCLVLIIAASGGAIWYYFAEMDRPRSIGGEPVKPAESTQEAAEVLKPQPSPIVSHATVVTPATTARAVLEPRHIAAQLGKLIPWDEVEKAPISSAVKKMLKEDLDEVLPNELAIMGGPNYESNQFEITLFANQQYFDVLIPIFGKDLLDRIPFVTWTENLKLRQPGALAASGSLPLPDGIAGKLQEHWSTLTPPADPLQPEGGHLFEIVLDNRNAALLALIGAGAAVNGLATEQVFAMPYMEQIPAVLSKLTALSVQADVGSAGELIVDVKLHKSDDAGPEVDMPISFVVTSFIIPELEGRLASEGLSLEGKAEWEGAVFHARYTVPNAESKVSELVQTLLNKEKKEKTPPAPATEPAAEASAQPQS